MNLIDLEILIPASPEFIWRFMGDLSAIPQWYEEVVSVSFLSTQREGQGTRWRHSTVRGNDVIVEVSAWYDTLGYEYRIIDGTTYSDNQGRIRLHEVTDGTLVRWTFQYASGGVLGGLRNAMRLKRSTTNQIQDSLRNLHRLIMEESGGISTHEAKASMQDAPDVQERSSYEPRHPSAFREVADDDTSLSESFPLSYDLELEPEDRAPVVDSDTKPNPVVLGSGDELISQAEPEPAIDDTQPVEVEALLAEIPPHDTTSPEPEPEPQVAEQTAPEATADPQPSLASLAPAPPKDSAHLSVFEIFGLQKPSEANAQASSANVSDSEPAQADTDDGRLAPADRFAPVARESDTRADDAPAYPAAPPTGLATISGWRRSARRKKALIRSHT